ncbi:MAG: transcription termination/antitermination protein NusG [Alphaproteobacteria bacterium]
MTEQRARWYVVSVHSNFENRVAEDIREQAARVNLSSLIETILIPKEDVLEVKNGVKTSKEKNFFPGYILVKMVLTDDTWHLVRSVPKVSGFLGVKERPSPMSQAEVNRILGQVQDSIDRPRVTLMFEIGEKVRVCEGPFASFAGLVEEVDVEKTRLKVSVSIFGRATPVDLDFIQVEKV